MCPALSWDPGVGGWRGRVACCLSIVCLCERQRKIILLLSPLNSLPLKFYVLRKQHFSKIPRESYGLVLRRSSFKKLRNSFINPATQLYYNLVSTHSDLNGGKNELGVWPILILIKTLSKIWVGRAIWRVDTKSLTQKASCTPMFPAALFTIAKETA